MLIHGCYLGFQFTSYIDGVQSAFISRKQGSSSKNDFYPLKLLQIKDLLIKSACEIIVVSLPTQLDN